jgi:hypothetical protein
MILSRKWKKVMLQLISWSQGRGDGESGIVRGEKAGLFVPYPFAAEDHQTVNAVNLVEKNAAMMVRDSENK